MNFVSVQVNFRVIRIIKNYIHKEMKCRSNLGNVCVHSVQNICLPYILLPKNYFFLYKSVFVLVYAAVNKEHSWNKGCWGEPQENGTVWEEDAEKSVPGLLVILHNHQGISGARGGVGDGDNKEDTSNRSSIKQPLLLYWSRLMFHQSTYI